jgi:hypothetical protein
MQRHEVLEIVKGLPHRQDCPKGGAPYVGDCSCGKTFIEKDLLFGEKGKTTLIVSLSRVITLITELTHAENCASTRASVCSCGRNELISYLYEVRNKSQK